MGVSAMVYVCVVEQRATRGEEREKEVEVDRAVCNYQSSSMGKQAV
jgi:hypothetical protein